MRPHPKPKRQVDRNWLDFVKTQRCAIRYSIVEHSCSGVIDPCHLTATGAHGSDYTAVAMCRKHHSEQHQIGIETFQEKYKVNLWRDALMLLIENKLD